VAQIIDYRYRTRHRSDELSEGFQASYARVKYQVSPPNAARAAATVAMILPTLLLGSRESNI